MRQHMKDYIEFGHSGAARSVRLMAEYMRAMESFEQLNGQPLVTVFGSARLGEGTNGSKLADEVSRACVQRGYGVVTGGSSGVMLAANKGAYEEARNRGLPVEKYSVGCAITLPFEEGTNKFLGTQTDFHYFFIRKFFLVAYSRAFFFLEGGGGTRDELWEVFCLIQTGKMPVHPLVALGEPEAWKTIKEDLAHMAARGTISEPDKHILHFSETAEGALDIVERFYKRIHRINYDKTRKTIDIFLKDRMSRADVAVLEERFAPHLDGLEWHDAERRLSASQFNFRSYTTLYELVDAINDLEQPKLP